MESSAAASAVPDRRYLVTLGVDPIPPPVQERVLRAVLVGEAKLELLRSGRLTAAELRGYLFEVRRLEEDAEPDGPRWVVTYGPRDGWPSGDAKQAVVGSIPPAEEPKKRMKETIGAFSGTGSESHSP